MMLVLCGCNLVEAARLAGHTTQVAYQYYVRAGAEHVDLGIDPSLGIGQGDTELGQDENLTGLDLLDLVTGLHRAGYIAPSVPPDLKAIAARRKAQQQENSSALLDEFEAARRAPERDDIRRLLGEL